MGEIRGILAGEDDVITYALVDMVNGNIITENFYKDYAERDYEYYTKELAEHKREDLIIIQLTNGIGELPL